MTRTILKGFSNSLGKNIKYTYIYKCTCNFIIFYEVYLSHYLSCTKSLPGKLKHLSFVVCCCSFNQHLGQYQKFDAIHTQSYLDPSLFISHPSCDLKKIKTNPWAIHRLSKSSKQTVSWPPLSIYGWFRTRNIISQGQVRVKWLH